jgi:flavin reductase (DIM6/NTAB) family NADH-FMN oxidoreductase RutF
MSTPVSDDLATRFRHAMAHLCAPVTIITAMDDRRPHGTTVSAVMSLSVEPLLVAVWLSCELESLLPGGDHTIVVGRVHTADTNTDAEPLTYHRRSFGTHAAHD